MEVEQCYSAYKVFILWNRNYTFTFAVNCIKVFEDSKSTFGTEAVCEMSRKTIILLYSILARLQLEYCIQFWTMHFRGGEHLKMFNVWRRGIRMIGVLEETVYRERLEALKTFTLEIARNLKYGIWRTAMQKTDISVQSCSGRQDKNQWFEL